MVADAHVNTRDTPYDARHSGQQDMFSPFAKDAKAYLARGPWDAFVQSTAWIRYMQWKHLELNMQVRACAALHRSNPWILYSVDMDMATTQPYAAFWNLRACVCRVRFWCGVCGRLFTVACVWLFLTVPVPSRQVTIEDFDVLRILGRGGFGEVYGCRKRDTGAMYVVSGRSR